MRVCRVMSVLYALDHLVCWACVYIANRDERDVWVACGVRMCCVGLSLYVRYALRVVCVCVVMGVYIVVCIWCVSCIVYDVVCVMWFAVCCVCRG